MAHDLMIQLCHQSEKYNKSICKLIVPRSEKGVSNQLKLNKDNTGNGLHMTQKFNEVQVTQASIRLSTSNSGKHQIITSSRQQR